MNILVRAACATLGVTVTGCTYIAFAESKREELPSGIGGWFRSLLVNEVSRDDGFVESEALRTPEPSPGRVLAWGGVFGRSPTPLDALGARVVRVAVAGDGLGAAIDADGRALIFAHAGAPWNATAVEDVALPMRATRVAWREAYDEAVFVDVCGDIHVTKVQRLPGPSTVKSADEDEYRGGDERRKREAEEGDVTIRMRKDQAGGTESAMVDVVQVGPVRRINLITRRRRRAEVREISCGRAHCLAISRDGAAFAWGGNNAHGELGLGDVGPPHAIVEKHSVHKDSKRTASASEDSADELALPGGAASVVEVACGGAHTLLLDARGRLYVAGSDGWAQLGRDARPWLVNAANRLSSSPTEATLLGELAGRAVAAGLNHSALLARDGTLFTCGFNQFGQLGHHNFATFAPPAPIADFALRVVHVVAGGNHTCVVTQTGTLRCAGANESGQLGTGSLQPSATWCKVRFNKRLIRPTFVHASSTATAVVIPVEHNHKNSGFKENSCW